MSRRMLPFIIAAGIIAGLLLFFAYCAPLEPASVTLYAGITIAVFGALCVVKPVRFFWIRKRRSGALLVAAGIAVGIAGLAWPTPRLHIASRASRLDDFMPEYNFWEFHEVRIHATPERAMAAIQATSFNDIRVFETLMRIRAAAFGHFRKERFPGAEKPVIEVFKTPGSGGCVLSDEPREVVMGIAGAPGTGRPPKITGPAEWRAFQAPGAIKIAFNMRVTDEGAGWSRVVTETRVWVPDQAARRGMARYWRAIYPGSGLMRRSWLNAIRERAERASPRSMAAR